MSRCDIRNDLEQFFATVPQRIHDCEEHIQRELIILDQWQTYFLYGAGRDGITVANFLKDKFKGRNVYFIDGNPSLDNVERVEGIKCYLPEKLYDYKDKSAIIIASSKHMDEILLNLRKSSLRHSIDNGNIYLCKSIVPDILHMNFLIGALDRKKESMDIFDSLYDEQSQKILYCAHKISMRGLSFLGYNPTDYLCGESSFLPEVILRRITLGNTLVCCGAFCNDMVQEISNLFANNYRCLYVFELNRIYASYMKKSLPNKVVVINAGLGLADARARRNELDADGNPKNRYFEWCSDDFISIKSLDSMITEKHVVGKISFVKLGIDNAEIDALEGMKEMLKRDKPVLALSIYSSEGMASESLYQMICCLKAIIPQYHFLLRQHVYDSALAGGYSVLYAFC